MGDQARTLCCRRFFFGQVRCEWGTKDGKKRRTEEEERRVSLPLSPFCPSSLAQIASDRYTDSAERLQD